MGNPISKLDEAEQIEAIRGKEWIDLTKEEVKRNEEFSGDNFLQGVEQVNQHKNRYIGVVPLEETRVKLTPIDDILGSDYINANFVHGVHKDGQSAYIAAQAPLPHTMYDFWRMIWEQHIQIIVMLTRLNEGGKNKANRYWPSKDKKTWNDITVHLISSNTSPSKQYKVKKFVITRSNKKRRITQFHYMGWPDHGVPENPVELVEMLEFINTTVEKKEDKVATKKMKPKKTDPLLIHCSAGIGRTGAFIVIDTVLKKFREEGHNSKILDNLSLKPILSSIRQQRPGMITQKEQYIFCYDAIAFAIKKESEEILKASNPTLEASEPFRSSSESEETCSLPHPFETQHTEKERPKSKEKNALHDNDHKNLRPPEHIKEKKRLKSKEKSPLKGTDVTLVDSSPDGTDVNDKNSVS